MKCIALILAILIALLPVVSTADYLINDGKAMFGGTLSEEERETEDEIVIDKEYVFSLEFYASTTSFKSKDQNCYIECMIQLQDYKENISPPPQV